MATGDDSVNALLLLSDGNRRRLAATPFPDVAPRRSMLLPGHGLLLVVQELCHAGGGLGSLVFD
jgi:hypothetical protein